MPHTFIIPTYGRLDLVQKCVTSIKRYEPAVHILLIDDGSPERESSELEKFSTLTKVNYFRQNVNGGFAKAVNAGLRALNGTRIATLINNDVLLTQKITDKIDFAFKRDSTIAIVGAKLTYPNGKIQHAGMKFDPLKQAFVHRYHGRGKHDHAVNTPDWVIAVTGALFSIRASVLPDIGYFNESYFVSCEDTEYCLRAWDKGYKVFYEPKVQAIHAEGQTRGATVQAKQQRNHKWRKLEIETVKRFQEDLRRFDLSKLLKNVRQENGEVKRVEVGSGFNPHPGYIHLDVRKGLPKLDYVCDFSKQRLPFDDGSVDEILANHVIEHISFRKLPFVVSEWVRVLSEGGKLTLRTPDLGFICRTYLSHNTTPEWPGDEEFIRKNLSDEITPSWWANLKLFSGQDYDANFHHVCFDFNMLSALLKRYGFSEVRSVKFDKEFSPGELQVEAVK